MKENNCGACGGFWKWVKPPHYKFFDKECALHDALYDLGGIEADRKKADVKLYEDMVKHSIDFFRVREKVGDQTWFIILAYVYYKSVRIFGKKRFKYKN